MAKTETGLARDHVVYSLEGTLLEACSCGVLCPCWIGEDPDGGECFAFNAYHVVHGEVDGVDVSGLNVVSVGIIPGNVLTPASWRVVILVDEHASDEQANALLRMFRGELGGPMADIASLVGEVLEVRRVPIVHEIVGGRGVLRAGTLVDAEMEPYTGPDGSITTLRDTIFSTVPGSPAYVAKASRHEVNLPEHGMVWSYTERNAIQSDWRMEHRA